MKISYNWLKELLPLETSAEETAALLTSVGLEVESLEKFESVKGGLKGVVVGQVMECGKHPGADKLSLTRVDVGSGNLLAIVCGAPNVAAGQKVLVATIGTTLHTSNGETLEIKKSKIRGEASEGMICAEDELGLGVSHAGIMVLPEEAPVGMPAGDYLQIENDNVFEIGLTPNRGDAASHLGVARDLAALFNSKPGAVKKEIVLNGWQVLPEASGLEKINIRLEGEGCRRYSGIVISGITVSESPAWLKNRLLAIGLRPLNNIVDITNYVLHETGQPLHAFDVEKITGKEIVVRGAREGEKFITLEGTERTLKEGDLMVCNALAPMCIAGVFGGMESGVTESTTSVFLESAYFEPAHVRRTAKNHGLKTDASFRFERGCDPDMTVKALQRAANLILQLTGGTVSMELTDVYPEKLEPFKVAFSYRNCTGLIGKEIERTVIKNILLSLGIEIETEGNDGLLLKVPRYKYDVTREADVVEEVMRIYGYNNVEVSKNIRFSVTEKTANEQPGLENKLGALLEGFGFSEIMGLSLSRESYYPNADTLIKTLNPLSKELSVLRASLLYGGLEAIAWNLNRKSADLKFFEFGKTYHCAEKDGKISYEEKFQLGIWITGRMFGLNPYGMNQAVDFSVLKAVVNNLLEKCGVTSFKTESSELEDMETSLTYFIGQKKVCSLGKVKTACLKNVDITQEVFYACIEMPVLVKVAASHKTVFKELAKFPSVRRDLALLIDKSVSYAQVEELAYSTEKKWLKEVNLFDIYESEKLGGKKSYAVSFTLQNQEATLTDKQIEGVMEKLIKNYKEKLGAELR